MLCNIFSDQIEDVIRYIEIFCGVGIGLGPFIGSLVYGFIGYEYTMYIFGTFNVAALILCYFSLPSVCN